MVGKECPQTLLPLVPAPVGSPPPAGELQLGRRLKEVTTFQPRVQLSLTWSGTGPAAGEGVGLYHYDPGRDSWREEGNYGSRYSRRVLGEVNKPGVYRALIGKVN